MCRDIAEELEWRQGGRVKTAKCKTGLCLDPAHLRLVSHAMLLVTAFFTASVVCREIRMPCSIMSIIGDGMS